MPADIPQNSSITGAAVQKKAEVVTGSPMDSTTAEVPY